VTRGNVLQHVSSALKEEGMKSLDNELRNMGNRHSLMGYLWIKNKDNSPVAINETAIGFSLDELCFSLMAPLRVDLLSQRAIMDNEDMELLT
jgi:uncharacterized protein YidB (DUF937 family)